MTSLAIHKHLRVQTRKTPKISAPFSPRTRKEAAKQDRKLSDNNHFTPAKHQRKHSSPNTTIWQRWNPL